MDLYTFEMLFCIRTSYGGNDRMEYQENSKRETSIKAHHCCIEDNGFILDIIL